MYNRHFGMHFKVFPMGGSVKMDRNWAFVLSPCERPDQDVSELVYDLLKDELERLQDASRAPWEVLLRSLASWTCLFKPEMGLGCPVLGRRIATRMCEQGQSVIFDMRKSLMIAPIDCIATTFGLSQEDDDEPDARVSLPV